jgi:hypothetical protein
VAEHRGLLAAKSKKTPGAQYHPSRMNRDITNSDHQLEHTVFLCFYVIDTGSTGSRDRDGLGIACLSFTLALTLAVPLAV